VNARLNIRPYTGLFKMRLIAGMQYRAAAWGGIATQFFWGGIELLVYSAFYRTGTAAGVSANFPFTQLADLIWMRQAFLALVVLWSQDNELLETVRSGNAAYEFCRPLSIYSFWFARLLALRFSRTLLRCFPILIIAFFLPEPYRFHLPPSAFSFLLFLPALFLAALLVVVISMFIYLLTFYTLNPAGSRLIVGVSGEFLMGALIPIPLMPLPLQRVLSWLPFRYTADFPFRVYSGSIAGEEALWGLLIQFVWIVTLGVLGAWGFRQARKRIVLQGG